MSPCEGRPADGEGPALVSFKYQIHLSAFLQKHRPQCHRNLISINCGVSCQDVSKNKGNFFRQKSSYASSHGISWKCTPFLFIDKAALTSQFIGDIFAPKLKCYLPRKFRFLVPRRLHIPLVGTSVNWRYIHHKLLRATHYNLRIF